MCAHANSHWPISFENWKHHDASQNSCMGVHVASSIDRMGVRVASSIDRMGVRVASSIDRMGVRVASSIDRMYRLLSGQYEHVNALTDLVEGRIIIGIHLSGWAQVPAHQ